MKSVLHRVPSHPDYCLDKLQNAKRGFQQQRLECQKKIELSKLVMARKRREITKMKRNLASVQLQHQLSKKRRRTNSYDDEVIAEFAAKQKHFMTVLERDIHILQRESKKFENMSLVASKIVDVMDQEYHQAVLHNRSSTTK
jgi:hypothetical protein